MDLALYLNVDERDPRHARVVSVSDLSRLPLPVFTHGDTLTIAIYLVTSAGAYHADSTDASLGRSLTLGIRGCAAVAQTEDFEAITNGFRCTLALTATQLALVLRAARTSTLSLIHKTTSGSAATTRCSLECTVLGDVELVDDGTDLTPSAYYTTAQVDALLAGVLQTPSAITTLTGGGASALDGIAVSGELAAGAFRLVYLTASGDLLLYRLAAGTTAESSPWVIAPDDGASFRWRLVAAISRDGVPLVWNTTQSKFHQFFANGAAGAEIPAFGPAITLGS